MLRALLFCAALSRVCAVDAQSIVPYITATDRFGVFREGAFVELEPRPPASMYQGADRLAYLTTDGQLRGFIGGHPVVLQQRGATDVAMAGNMLAWRSGEQLLVATDEGAKVISEKVGQFTVRDSLIAFHDLADSTLNVYWRARSFPVADVRGQSERPQWSAGSNSLLFFDHAKRQVHLFYRGNTQVLCGDSDFSRVSPGGDIVAYMDDGDDTFRVLDHGRRVDVEQFSPVSFTAGAGLVGYVSATGELRCWNEGAMHSLAKPAPTAYYVQDSVITWVDKGKWWTLVGEERVMIEPFVPEKWAVSGAMITYLDLNRELHLFERGHRIEVNKDAGIKDFTVGGKAIAWRSQVESVKVWWKGKVYELF